MSFERPHPAISRPALRALVLATVAWSLVACQAGTEEPNRSFPDVLVLGGRRYESAALARGADVYSQSCRPCHGARGDGQGPSSGALNPPPRDFTRGLFKFVSVAAGQLPTDEDLTRTITQGLAGTAMRGWDLPPAQVADVIGYLKTLSPRWTTESPGTPLVAAPDPWTARRDDAVARGKLVYHGLAQCAVACHPAYVSRAEIRAATKQLTKMEVTQFRADLFASVPKPSDYGVDVVPPDFTFNPVRTGTSLEALHRVIASGVGGTAMPTWNGVLPEADLWALAHYVRSVATLRDTAGAEVLRASLASSGP